MIKSQELTANVPILITVTELRTRTKKLLERLKIEGGYVFLSQNGKLAGVVMAPAEFGRMVKIFPIHPKTRKEL
jgi:hypothetical protein